MSRFADQVIDRCRSQGHPLCVGVDPHLALIPSLFQRGDPGVSARSAANCIERFCMTVLESLQGRAISIKPQIAFFEALGVPGLQVLSRLLKVAREHQQLVVLDAKRGDIGSTASAYAEAFLSPGGDFEADALTVNPYLGLDSLEPFITSAERYGKGLFVLTKTSNPGSSDLQDKLLGERPLFEAVARLLASQSTRLQGERTTWSGLGMVVGATHPRDAPTIRALHPNGLMLVPGFGAQGGTAAAAVRGFVPGADGRLEGGIVNASRSVLFPTAAQDQTTLSGWTAAFDRNLDHTIETLRTASAGQAGAQPDST